MKVVSRCCLAARLHSGTPAPSKLHTYHPTLPSPPAPPSQPHQSQGTAAAGSARVPAGASLPGPLRAATAPPPQARWGPGCPACEAATAPAAGRLAPRWPWPAAARPAPAALPLPAAPPAAAAPRMRIATGSMRRALEAAAALLHLTTAAMLPAAAVPAVPAGGRTATTLCRAHHRESAHPCPTPACL